ALGLGHERFMFVGPRDGAESTADRWRGFEAGLAGHTHEIDNIDIGRPSAHVLERVKSSRTSIVFFTELADAIPFRRLAIAEGLSVPGDLSVVVLGSHVRPGNTATNFTTYAIPREEMARGATLALIARL